MPGLLTVFVHPDDETMVSGLVCALRERGVPIHLAVVTRGEGGKTGRPPLVEQSKLGELREQEMRQAASFLGASSLHFFDAVDPCPRTDESGKRLLEAPRLSFEDFRLRFQGILDSVRPQVLISHGSNGEYGHPGHLLIGSYCRRALSALSTPSLTFYSGAARDEQSKVRSSNRDDPPSLFVDARPYHEQMSRLMLIHKSQHLSWLPDSLHSDLDQLDLLKHVQREREGYRLWPEHGSDTNWIARWLALPVLGGAEGACP